MVMSDIPQIAIQASELPSSSICYSICTLVTRPEDYAEMVDSFVKAGFNPSFCEFLYLDNYHGNRYDGYSGYNLFLQTAQGQYIILCHQDVRLQFDRIEDLERRIHELDGIDPAWAIIGNAGGARAGVIVSRITHPDGEQNRGPFPMQVGSVDENFILVKREANLCLSHNMRGFHFYGTDLCRIARVLGRTAWVVNFHLYHGSRGDGGDAFYEAKSRLIRKYKSALRGSVIQTTCTKLCLSGSGLASWLLNPRERWVLFSRVYLLRKRARHEHSSVAAQTEKRLMNSLGQGWYAAYWLPFKFYRLFQNIKNAIVKHVFHRTKSLESKLAHKYLDGLTGLEIGGSAHNPFGLQTRNVDFTADTNTVFKQEEKKRCQTPLKVDIVAPGDELPVPDESQDFVISSHVIEHFFDPIKTLKEWHRVVKPGGYIFLIVPHKERTFDIDRPRTPLAEIIARHTGEIPKPTVDDHGHHSVWITGDFLELCRYLKLNVIEYQDKDDKTGNGFAVVIKK
jgi:SAM-dependent methyltransferase